MEKTTIRSPPGVTEQSTTLQIFSSMASLPPILLILLFIAVRGSSDDDILKVFESADGRKGNVGGAYCRSWHFAVEVNDVGNWKTVPRQCVPYVKRYMTGKRYLLDSSVVASESLRFAKSVNVTGDGKDAWVFDIDETLLSNLPYYAANGFGSEPFNETTFDVWVDKAKAPALPASLKLYREIKRLGFHAFLLTGRSEHQRNLTVANLRYAGFSSWEKLILRGPEDQGKPATRYKSEKRAEVEKAGYRIHGSSGDQWSDLLGFATATRSFKLPNPMYYIR